MLASAYVACGPNAGADPSAACRYRIKLHGSAQYPPPEPETVDEVPVVATAGGFEDPASTCDALASEGFTIMPRTRWNPDLTNAYDCTSEDVIVTPGVPLDNTLRFYVMGDADGETVGYAQITAAVSMPDASAAVLDRLAASAEAFARYLGSEAPPELALAIRAGERETVPLGEYVVNVTRDAYNQGHGVVVTFGRAQ